MVVEKSPYHSKPMLPTPAPLAQKPMIPSSRNIHKNVHKVSRIRGGSMKMQEMAGSAQRSESPVFMLVSALPATLNTRWLENSGGVGWELESGVSRRLRTCCACGNRKPLVLLARCVARWQFWWQLVLHFGASTRIKRRGALVHSSILSCTCATRDRDAF